MIEFSREALEYYKKTGLPFVTNTTTTTLDGKIATITKSSKYISCHESLVDVHRLRHLNQAILVGVNTVIDDNPSLTVRHLDGGRNPIRVVLDSTLKIPLESKLIHEQEAPTWVYTTTNADEKKKRELEKHGVLVFPVTKGTRVQIIDVLKHLGEKGVSSLLVEGGSEINGSFLDSKSINKVVKYIAPKLVGGRTSPTSYAGEGVMLMDDAILLERVKVSMVGQDIKIEGYPLFK